MLISAPASEQDPGNSGSHKKVPTGSRWQVFPESAPVCPLQRPAPASGAPPSDSSVPASWGPHSSFSVSVIQLLPLPRSGLAVVTLHFHSVSFPFPALPYLATGSLCQLSSWEVEALSPDGTLTDILVYFKPRLKNPFASFSSSVLISIL